jgi:hypothetical protein
MEGTEYIDLMPVVLIWNKFHDLLEYLRQQLLFKTSKEIIMHFSD